MKLVELINVVDPETNVTFEITEETYPTGIYLKDILEKYSHADNYEVKELSVGYYTDDNKKVVPTLMIEVTNKAKRRRMIQ